MSLPHDSGYRQLFQHAIMVEHLLRGFVPESWVAQLDFSSLQLCNGHYVKDHLAERRSDLVWRVRLADEGWLYVYVLLEFQSRDDAWMALRMLAYVSLLYQDLVKTGECTRPGELPPVFPVVVYHGSTPWRAAREMRGLFAQGPDTLAAYRPSLRYFVLDEHRTGLPDAEDNLVGHLTALERSPSPEATRRCIMQLHRHLTDPRHDTLRRAFTVYIQRVLLRRLVPGETIPEVNDLQEMDAMLADRVVEWTEKWKQDGMKAGFEQGLQKGQDEGRVKGRLEGMLEGQRTLLLTLLTARFGAPLPGAVESRVRQGSEVQIAHWTTAILQAPDLDTLFGTSGEDAAPPA